jgi:hypothetical protein
MLIKAQLRPNEVENKEWEKKKTYCLTELSYYGRVHDLSCEIRGLN